MSEEKKKRPVPVLHQNSPKKKRPETNSHSSNELDFFWDDSTLATTHFELVSQATFKSMFEFDNFAPKLDEYKAFYSVEPLWIGQMKQKG